MALRGVVAISAMYAMIGFGWFGGPVEAQDTPFELGTTIVSSPDGHTGLSGRVVLAGRCPVPVGDDDGTCPSPPLVTEVTLRAADGGAEMARVTTDSHGGFTIALDPGNYLLEVPAVAQTAVVSVASDGLTLVTMRVRPRVPD